MAYTVNCSILLTGLPINERAAAAKAAGFDAVEFWWPFATAVPAQGDIDAFTSSIEKAGVQLTGLNFFAGNMAGGERGLVSWPKRSGEFQDNIDVVVEIAERLGTRAFNALYGNRIDGVDPARQDEVALTNLALAADAVASIGGTVLLEPVSGGDTVYPVKTAQDALDIIEKTGKENIKLLADFYHLSVNGDDVASVIDEHASEFGHIQIADAPGRGQPGTGNLPLMHWIQAAQDGGYTGPIGLEYRTDAANPFEWLARSATLA